MRDEHEEPDERDVLHREQHERRDDFPVGRDLAVGVEERGGDDDGRHDADDPREEDVRQSPAHRGRRRVRSSGRPGFHAGDASGARRGRFPSRTARCAATTEATVKEWAPYDGRSRRGDRSSERPGAEMSRPPSEMPPGRPAGGPERRPGDRPTPPPGPPSWTRMLPWLLILALVGVFALTNVFSLDTSSTKDVSYSHFISAVKEGNVSKVEFDPSSGELNGTFKTAIDGTKELHVRGPDQRPARRRISTCSTGRA